MADPVLNEQPLEFCELFEGDINSTTADLFCERTLINTELTQAVCMSSAL